MNQLVRLVFCEKKHLNSNNKKAFTMAEVLITLAVIGVVAALTIPSLVANNQKNQVVTQLKKSFSVMSQAINNSIVDNGQTAAWDWPSVLSNDETNRVTKTYFLPYLKYSKICTSDENTGDCSRYSMTYLDGVTPITMYTYYMVFMNDGSIYYIKPMVSEAYVRVDLNGKKPPNVVGRDIFFMILYKGENQLDFYGAKKRTGETIKTDPIWGCQLSGSTMAGDFCGALIQMDGWQITDNYPWD